MSARNATAGHRPLIRVKSFGAIGNLEGNSNSIDNNSEDSENGFYLSASATAKEGETSYPKITHVFSQNGCTGNNFPSNVANPVNVPQPVSSMPTQGATHMFTETGFLSITPNLVSSSFPSTPIITNVFSQRVLPPSNVTIVPNNNPVITSVYSQNGPTAYATISTPASVNNVLQTYSIDDHRYYITTNNNNNNQQQQQVKTPLVTTINENLRNIINQNNSQTTTQVKYYIQNGQTFAFPEKRVNYPKQNATTNSGVEKQPVKSVQVDCLKTNNQFSYGPAHSVVLGTSQSLPVIESVASYASEKPVENKSDSSVKQKSFLDWDAAVRNQLTQPTEPKKPEVKKKTYKVMKTVSSDSKLKQPCIVLLEKVDKVYKLNNGTLYLNRDKTTNLAKPVEVSNSEIEEIIIEPSLNMPTLEPIKPLPTPVTTLRVVNQQIKKANVLTPKSVENTLDGYKVIVSKSSVAAPPSTTVVATSTSSSSVASSAKALSAQQAATWKTAFNTVPSSNTLHITVPAISVNPKVTHSTGDKINPDVSQLQQSGAKVFPFTTPTPSSQPYVLPKRLELSVRQQNVPWSTPSVVRQDYARSTPSVLRQTLSEAKSSVVRPGVAASTNSVIRQDISTSQPSVLRQTLSEAKTSDDRPGVAASTPSVVRQGVSTSQPSVLRQTLSTSKMPITSLQDDKSLLTHLPLFGELSAPNDAKNASNNQRVLPLINNSIIPEANENCPPGSSLDKLKSKYNLPRDKNLRLCEASGLMYSGSNLEVLDAGPVQIKNIVRQYAPRKSRVKYTDPARKRSIESQSEETHEESSSFNKLSKLLEKKQNLFCFKCGKDVPTTLFWVNVLSQELLCEHCIKRREDESSDLGINDLLTNISKAAEQMHLSDSEPEELSAKLEKIVETANLVKSNLKPTKKRRKINVIGSDSES